MRLDKHSVWINYLVTLLFGILICLKVSHSIDCYSSSCIDLQYCTQTYYISSTDYKWVANCVCTNERKCELQTSGCFPGCTHFSTLYSYSDTSGYRCICSECNITVPNPAGSYGSCGSGGVGVVKYVCYTSITGRYCDINACAMDLCQNGTCMFNRSGYTCTCFPGYTGIDCDKEINECDSTPCKHNGTCDDMLNGYNCTCEQGYAGRNCEQEINECDSAPCQHNSTCDDMINGYNCTCVQGYGGINCEQEINECGSSPCQNNGTCDDVINGYNCTCVDGYTGVSCEQEINECDSTPCQHNGTCNDNINQYNCTCVQGYTGINCEQDINECKSSPCENGGDCNNLVNSYTCTCKEGFEGVNCEQVQMCDCDCGYQQRIEVLQTVNPKPIEQLEAEMQPVLEQIKKTLTVEKKNLTSTLRKKISATDGRKSSQQIGILGVVFLILVFGSVIFPDLVSVIKYIAALTKISKILQMFSTPCAGCKELKN